jgi:hypothetical protein
LGKTGRLSKLASILSGATGFFVGQSISDLYKSDPGKYWTLAPSGGMDAYHPGTSLGDLMRSHAPAAQGRSGA